MQYKKAEGGQGLWAHVGKRRGNCKRSQHGATPSISFAVGLAALWPLSGQQYRNLGEPVVDCCEH
jgi:hypothetical protein